jgi:hypothetical protein
LFRWLSLDHNGGLQRDHAHAESQEIPRMHGWPFSRSHAAPRFGASPRHRPFFRLVTGCLLPLCCTLAAARAQESLWVEAEHLEGIRGYCWPMGRPEMKQTSGHWALSGPGWAAEWNQGGESGFLSIATGADDVKAVASKQIELPVDGQYHLWVRYADWRETPEPFQIQIEQAGRPAHAATFGEAPVVEEDNEMKLYWNWAFGWGRAKAALIKGPARLKLVAHVKAAQPRQVDCIVLTTEDRYRPRVKDRPRNHTWELLDRWRGNLPRNLEPLARRLPDFNLPAASEPPAVWKLKSFRDQGFLYLWNVSHTNSAETWLSDKPDRVKVPYNVSDPEVRAAFEKKYAGRDDVPIFNDPRVTPTFHGVGPGVFATDAASGTVNDLGLRFSRWLEANPQRSWAMMMNYHNGLPIGDLGVQLFQRFRDRYVGSISGESLGYFYWDAEEMRRRTAAAQTRRQLVEAFAPYMRELNAAKYRAVFGRDLDANPYQDVIPCLSVGNIIAAPLAADWGARTIGYESSAATSSLLSMRWAFLRGAARQHGIQTCTYRSCNFGDSSTLFSPTATFSMPKNILDNYYSVFSGAGMTWYKFDIWYQYMAGSSMFYHEQGFDEFWQPGGTTAAGIHEVQLSPKGKLVDRFLRTTAARPERGVPVTPVAFLVDYAHGWEPAPFWPNSFKNWHENQERFRFGEHEKMLEQYFWTAYHPIGRESERPITGTNEVNVPGIFGDIFDVIYAYPDVAKWRSIDAYPVVIAAGDIELTEAEGARLVRYVEEGGTLVVAHAQVAGPGAAQLKLPACGAIEEAAGYRWMDETLTSPSQRYRFLEILAGTEPRRVLATTPEGKPWCAAFDRGAGRLVYVSVPRGLGIDQAAHPVVARLIAHARSGLLPLEVAGDVEWMLNRAPNGWLVTLLNPAGQDKPQQGITPTDYRQNRVATIFSRLPGARITSAQDWLLPGESLSVNEGAVVLEVPAGGVRIIELN